MRIPMTLILAGALIAAPMAASAGQATKAPAPATKSQTPPPSKATTPAKPTKAAATHATTGTVKSLDATTLVITRPGKRGGDMTFMLNASTQRDGSVAVGTPVSVRYQMEGKDNVALAITAEKAKTAPKKSGK
jgi:hypothetical protein